MSGPLSGRRALVGGASRGIGKATAVRLAENGAEVVCLARTESALASLMVELPAAQGQSHSFVCVDNDHPEALGDRVARHLGDRTVHILVNNTGGPPEGTAHEASLEDYRIAFNQHLVCNQVLLQQVLPGMRAAGFGRVINIISTSVKQPIPNLGVSNTVRGAVANWAKTLAGELGPHGITVNNVLPGFTETDRLDEIVASRAASSGQSAEAIAAALSATVPMRRFASPAETAAVIAFLAGPDAGYLNGINVPVDGGRTGSL